MASYKAPSLMERQAAATEARQKALEKLKARPPVDEAVLAERRAAAAAKEEAAAVARAEKIAAREAEKIQREADKVARLAAIEAAKPAPKPQLTEAERKAERDRRYAERKARK